MRSARPLALVGLFVGCGGLSASPPRPVVSPTSDAPLPTELEIIAFSKRWIEDDYDRALAEARRDHKAVFVDVWAAFCHTCLHMREHVLDDPRLRGAGADVVWLSIEVDRPSNEAFVRAHAAAALPTFFVLDENGKERARWVGSMDVEQVERFVRGGVATDPALARVTDLYLAGRHDDCAREGLGSLEGPATYGRLGVLATALACSTARLPAPAECQQTTGARLCRETSTLRARVRQDLDALRIRDRAEQLERADDLSSAYEVLIESADVEPAEIGTAQAWVALLDGLARDAKTKERRAALDPHRVLAYRAAGTPEKSLPLLEQSRLEFPQDYNPNARLAGVYLTLRRYPEADSANRQALSLVYGPRTLRVYAQRADILRSAGRSAEELAALDEALAWAKGRWLPEGGKKVLADLQARRAAHPAAAR